MWLFMSDVLGSFDTCIPEVRRQGNMWLFMSDIGLFMSDIGLFMSDIGLF